MTPVYFLINNVCTTKKVTVYIFLYFSFIVNQAFSQDFSIQLDIDSRYQQNFLSVRSIITSTGKGSGFIIHPDGWMITANHVLGDIKSASPPIVRGPNRELALPIKVRALEHLDIALVKLRNIQGGLIPAKLTNTVTDTVYIGKDIGMISAREFDAIIPNATGNTVKRAVITTFFKKGTISSNAPFSPFIAANIDIIQGDSGGLVFDLETGNVIGVVSGIATQILESEEVRQLNNPHSFKDFFKIIDGMPHELINPISDDTYSIKVQSHSLIYSVVVPVNFIKQLMKDEGIW